jgi:hypothetical protein
LLIRDVLIALYKDIEPGLLGGIQQRTVLKTLPLKFPREDYSMSFERSGQRSWSVSVK